MPDYHPQIARIRHKLTQVRAADPRRKVFGANGHHYRLTGPVPTHDLLALEQRYSISLPAGYRLFMQEIGPGAGPFYGLYDPRQHAEELVTSPLALQWPSRWRPRMSAEEWAALTLPFESEISGIDYEQAADTLFAGLLPLGTQGCTYYHALVVSGEQQGRVVNLDVEFGLPRFAFEVNFLDWYERWLDEILDGTLLREGPDWFGYQRGGTEAALLAGFQAATEPAEQSEYLGSLTRLLAVSPVTLDQLAQACTSPYPQVSQRALACLTQFDYALARPLLRALWPTDPLWVAKLVNRFAESHADEWVAELQTIFTTANPDPELFATASYLARKCTADLSPLLKPWINHPNPRFSKQAAYSVQEMASQRTIWQRLRRLLK